MTAAPALPGATRITVAVEGVRFSVQRAAPGRARQTTPVLLLHGVPQTSLMWRDLLPELAHERVVLAPDLKGLGDSEVAGPYDLPTLVGELGALVLHEAAGPIDVVGHDWGGALGIALAASRPGLVRRIVVVNAPSCPTDLRRAYHIPLLALPVLPELAFRLAGPALVHRMIGYAWRARGRPPADILAAYAQAYADPARVAAMLCYYRALVRPFLPGCGRPRFAGRPPPARPAVHTERTLVVWGALDPVLPLSVGQSLARALGANTTMVSLPGVGHFPVEEAPDVAVPTIAEFLRA